MMMPNLQKIEHKIFKLSSETAKNIGSHAASFSGKTVFTNGCFDLVHTGHVNYLSKAADLGDYLIIGLNSDQSVTKLKGPQRPIKDEINRALVLASFFFVDMVVIFDEDTPFGLIQSVKPDILVKGGDYDPTITDPNDPLFIVGSNIVAETKVIQFVEGYSSSKLIEKSKS